MAKPKGTPNRGNPGVLSEELKVRLAAPELITLQRLAIQRRQSVSKTIREAIARMAGKEEEK
jgi:hypothetical protein